MFAGWAAQTVRLYPGARAVEAEWTVGPVPVEGDGVGKEVVARYTTGIASAGRLWADSNARDMLPRRRCVAGPGGAADPACRASVPAGYKVTEPVAGNYYPVNAQVMLGEGRARLPRERAGGHGRRARHVPWCGVFGVPRKGCGGGSRAGRAVPRTRSLPPTAAAGAAAVVPCRRR